MGKFAKILCLVHSKSGFDNASVLVIRNPSKPFLLILEVLLDSFGFNSSVFNSFVFNSLFDL